MEGNFKIANVVAARRHGTKKLESRQYCYITEKLKGGRRL